MTDLRPYHKLEEWFAGKIMGAFSAFDMEALATGCARLKKDDVYVEVGTQNGRSAYSAFTMLPKGVKCFAVDIADAGKNADTMSRADFFKEYLPKWKFIHKASELAAKDWKLPIDMMFIDADHSYAGVKLDVESWYPFVKSGGYMYFHDVDKTSPGVEKLFRQMKKDKRFTDVTYYKKIQKNNTSMGSVKVV